jgi:2-oxoisovalerate ferredoxin oxidoreductase beta subunit
MTGGQMAPTTLIGQVSTTTPFGRRAGNEGYPLHMSELLSTLEAPVYIERVALSDNKNTMKARKAIRKAVELQRDGVGFTFVEILSPCPTIWKMTPVEARDWVAEKMIPVFPLKVFRDQKPKPIEDHGPAVRSVAEVLELDEPAPTTAGPVRLAEERLRSLKVKAAGFGGQGILLLGQILAEMGMREGLEVSWLPSYGPEMRSGSAHCHVCLSAVRISSPLVEHPDVLIAMNELSLRKFAAQVAPGGIILYNSESLPANFSAPQARVICLPASDIADKLGAAKVGNVVMLGALLAETEALPVDTALAVLQDMVKSEKMLELDRRALEAGLRFRTNHSGAEAGVENKNTVTK